jgi:site-specific DNA-methyltransferase (adenine-specific)
LEILADKYPQLARFIATIGGVHSKPMMSYLTYIAQRIIEMHRILKDTGSFYLHCDQTAGHYLKILLDFIFGKNNFRNEIIWRYSSGGASKKFYSKNHDNIYFYTKSNKYTFNSNDIKVERTEKSLERSKNPKGARYDKKNILKLPEDVFDIQYLNPMAKERVGYPTQKPLKLLERIIQASSKEGDIVMDPFCGCATTCVAAQQLGRKWIGIDIEKQAVNLLVERLSDDSGLFTDFKSTTLIPKRTDVRYEPKAQEVRERLYKEQNGICNGCGNEYLIKDLDVDHIIPVNKGGGDYYENYQLLCGNCNKIKGERPMEYLRNKIKMREEMIKNKIEFGK